MTKDTDGGLLMADATRSQVDPGDEELIRQGDIELRGRAEALVLWHLPLEPHEAKAAVEPVGTP